MRVKELPTLECLTHLSWQVMCMKKHAYWLEVNFIRKGNFMKYRKCMVDIESYGLQPGCKIAAIAGVEFHYLQQCQSQFYREIQRDNQGKLTEDNATLIWWAKQTPETNYIIFNPRPEACLLIMALMDFTRYLHGLVDGDKRGLQMWAKPASFDLILLARAYREFGLEVPWDEHDGVVCMKTFKRFFSQGIKFPEFVGREHNALDDCKNQVVQTCMMLKKYKELIHDRE